MQTIKLGLDCPTGWLFYIEDLVDYHYILVDKALKDSTYLKYFKNRDKLKLLNNRAMMQGVPLPLDEIKKVWDILGGQVIAPDWMWDPERTFNAYEDCCKAFGKENVIGVLQGMEEEDVDRYGDEVAIPFDLGSEKEEPWEVKADRRIRMVEKLKGKKIHLLGLTSPRELEHYGCDSVVSLNTGLPILLAMQKKDIRNFEEDKRDSAYHSMDMDFPLLDNSTYKLMRENIKIIRRLLGCEV